MEDIVVESLMTQNVTCATPDTPISSVVQTMKEHRFSCVVVVENKIPVGMITERDMVSYLSQVINNGSLEPKFASDIMSVPPITIYESETVYRALVVARANQIRHLPVINKQGVIKGLVTQSDLSNEYLNSVKKISGNVEEYVQQRTKDLIDTNEKLRALCLEDGLLGIGNRRAMEVDLEHTHEAAIRYKNNYSVALFDFDNFKLYNDHYGHPAGDKVLKEVVQSLRGLIRKCDRLYRYGGEEILLLLPETQLSGAIVLAERLIRSTEALAIPHARNPRQVITLSVGVANKGEMSTWVEVVNQADLGLYHAKKNGRNQIGCVSDDNSDALLHIASAN